MFHMEPKGGSEKELRPGPLEREDGIKGLKDRLDGMSGETKDRMKRLMGDRDLESLNEEQQLAIQEMTLLRELNMATEARVRGWLLEDRTFQECFERRRVAGLRRWGFEADEALAKAAVEGDISALRLYYQKTGTLPVGGEYARMPEEVKGGKDLESVVQGLLEKALSKRGGADGGGSKG